MERGENETNRMGMETLHGDLPSGLCRFSATDESGPVRIEIRPAASVAAAGTNAVERQRLSYRAQK